MVVDDRAMNEGARRAVRNLGADIDPDVLVRRLSIAQRQLVQIARVLLVPHRVVIFDEPTASLTPIETQALLEVIADIRAKGVGVFYISHRLPEVKQIADKAKMMMTDPSIIIDEPTRGIDIGTKEQIYRFIAALAAQGRSIIVISSEMQELIGICDRIIVMRSGRIVGAVTSEQMNEGEIVVPATGVKSGEAA
jgi:ABC-type sugar transport system ATPase subunit